MWGPTAGQEAVWSEAVHLVQSALDGYNVCIFAYGQTGGWGVCAGGGALDWMDTCACLGMGRQVGCVGVSVFER